jgi:hypothetical protein
MLNNSYIDFIQWGRLLELEIKNLKQENPDSNNFLFAVNKAKQQNSWFTINNIVLALQNCVSFLSNDSLRLWSSNYKPHIQKCNQNKKIALIMAGNIPAVGFQDLLYVLLTGNNAQVKLSSEDSFLIPAMLEILYSVNNYWKSKIDLVTKISGFDAVIATGSNNSARYFEYYFGKFPNIIRKSRTSLAVIYGDENEQDWKNLQNDIFSYFGMGCRSVNFLCLLKGVSLERVIQKLEPQNQKELLYHHKYLNNLDYHKSVFLINREKFFDGGTVLFKESTEIFSPLSVIHYNFFENMDDVKLFINSNDTNLQCIVDKDQNIGKILPGTSQLPSLLDYPDNIDITNFILSLK